MRRVMVIGCPGAGKTTFARELSRRMGLPWICLDTHFWNPGWQPTPEDEWRGRVAELAARSEWVMDGNFHATFDLRLPRADTVIWLDLSRRICMRRVVTRTLCDHGRARADLPDGCPERFDRAFLRYVWRFPVDVRPHVVSALQDAGAHLRIFRLDRAGKVRRFLASGGEA